MLKRLYGAVIAVKLRYVGVYDRCWLRVLCRDKVKMKILYP